MTTELAALAQRQEQSSNCEIYQRPAGSKLRFRSLRNKAQPPDFIFIDTALDKLGEMLHRERWSICCQLSTLPFQFKNAKGKHPSGYFSFELRKRAGEYYLKRIPLDVQRSERRAYQESAKLYAETIGVLRAALYDEKITAHRHSVRQEVISKKGRGIWFKQSVQIFYAGSLVSSDRTKSWPILIPKESFQTWLASLESQINTHETCPGSIDLPAVAEAISKHVLPRGYKLYREQFCSLARDTLAAAGVSAPATKARELWNALAAECKMKCGHPKSVHTPDQMDSDRAELQQVIRSACLANGTSADSRR